MINSSLCLRILIIDDNPAIHDDFRKVLIQEQESPNIKKSKKNLFDESITPLALPRLRIDSAYQGEEGFSLVQQALNENNPYAMAFVDIRMPPGWDGIQTIMHIWKADPNIQIVICTAFSDYSWIEIIERLGHSDRLLILKKPFDDLEVCQIAYSLSIKWYLANQLNLHLEHLQELVDIRTKELQSSFSFVRSILESTLDGILAVDCFGKITDYNAKFLELWNINSSDLKRRNENNLVKTMAKKLKDPESFLKQEIQLHNYPQLTILDELTLNNGTILERFTQPQYVGKDIAGRVSSFRDITQRKNMEKQLIYQATHDPLTGLPNRLLLQDRIQQSIVKAKRTHAKIAVLFLDIDRFKLINDTLGHSYGDLLLREVATRLLNCVREKDTVAYYGGDKFVIVLPDIKHENEAAMIAHNIIGDFSMPYLIDKHKLVVTISMGVSIYPHNGLDAETLLKNADTAMYRVKTFEQNNFQFYTEDMMIQVLDYFQLEYNLRMALERKEFILYYQPIYDLKTNSIISVEALLRWKHPVLGMILPQRFIPIAEETGLIIPIGQWVLATACQQNKKWLDKGLNPIKIAVNLSPYQIRHKNLIPMLEQVLEESQMLPQYLELEITESSLMENTAEIVKTLYTLKKMGISLSIDDFGTGYSNLSYLSRLPIGKLKIDQSFVYQMTNNDDEIAIILTIISLARTLNIPVLAEGIETKEQLELLYLHGCDEGQGYYFSHPVDAKMCTRLLNKKSKKND